MRAPAFLLVCFLLLPGCTTSDEPGSTTTPEDGAAGDTSPAEGIPPTEVYRSTISFSVQTEGEQELPVPAGARSLTLDVTMTSDAGVTTTADVRIAIEDASGDVVLDCEQGFTAVGGESGCGPKTNSINDTDGPFRLVWSGSGNVEADVIVTAE